MATISGKEQRPGLPWTHSHSHTSLFAYLSGIFTLAAGVNTQNETRWSERESESSCLDLRGAVTSTNCYLNVDQP